MATAPMNGRKAQAARNDVAILDAAREVFLADPGAPIAAVATRAGVGISALYRRYPSKEGLLQALARDGLTRFRDDIAAALAERGDPWDAYRGCLERILAGNSQGLAQRLAGTFAPTAELGDLATEAGALFAKLHRRAQRAGVLRKDVSTADVVLLLEMLMLIELPRQRRGSGLRHRYLALVLQSLRPPVDGVPAPLPGRPAADADLAARWSG